VSSLVGTERSPRAAAARGRRVTIAIPWSLTHLAIAGGSCLALVLAAFVATGGLQLERTTKVLVGFMLVGAAVVAAGLVRRPRSEAAPLHGGGTLLAVAALAALTALSIIWSVAPADSWFEAERTFAYVAVFAAGVALVRLSPRGWASLLAGVGIACALLSVWALLTKVFPASLASDEIYARLRQPFDYWNSVGLTAALGVPPMLWVASRRSGHAAVNALAWPVLVVLLTTLMLAYSRGSLLALGIGVAAWFIVVPLRLRGLAALLAAAVGAGLLVLWTFNQDGLSTDNAPMAARVDAGHELGALLLLAGAAALIVGLVVQFAAAQHPPHPRAREVAGRVAIGAVVAAFALFLVVLSTRPGGIDGQVSKGWHQLTDTNARPPDNSAGRLVATSSVRARYWDEALKIHAKSPWVGAGAGGYATARTRFRKDTLFVRQAHGYVVQTLADLGWVGLAVSLAALAAWLYAAARALGLRRRDRGLPWDAERVGLAALATMVLIFGVHSAIDWTWFVPANAATALLCAGWVAGRGPLRARLERRGIAGSAAVAPPPRDPDAPATNGPASGVRRRLAALRELEGVRYAAAALVLVIALAAAWSAWQPVRSQHASDAAFDRLDEGQPGPAAAIAQIAVRRNPLSADPLFDLAAIQQARGLNQDAERALERAVRLQPADAETWRRLGRLKLSVLHDARGALEDFRAAYFLDPRSPQSASDVIEATRAAGG
jgi:tetratricopeptide (TPR) repeat protein